MIVLWVMAGSLVVIALSAAAYVWLRISDEVRFRRALDGVEKGAKRGMISIPTVSNGGGQRVHETRRERAEQWLEMKKREGDLK